MLSQYAFIALVFVSAVVSQTVEVGHCQVIGSANDPTITGYIDFVTNQGSVEMTVNVSGITVGADIPHGIHIHQYGDISTTDASRTGTHWNPTNVAHGCPTTGAPRHYGDTGNWTAVGGVIVGTKLLDLISLTGTYSIIGFAVIIHAGTDDCLGTTSAGARLAQCVIGVANPTYYSGTVNTANPSPVAPYPNTTAICNLAPTLGSTASGVVYFEPQGANTRVRAVLSGLTAGSIHGFHMHAYGDLRTSNGLGTGGHWNPLNASHGIPPFSARHLGDLGNVYYYVGQVAYYEYSFTVFGLNSAAWNILGRGVILHNLTDDCGQPVGNAGARLAQCVIGYANPVSTNYTFPVGVPTTQDDARCYGVTSGVAVGTSTGAGEMSSSDAALMSVFVMLSFILAVLFA